MFYGQYDCNSHIISRYIKCAGISQLRIDLAHAMCLECVAFDVYIVLGFFAQCLLEYKKKVQLDKFPTTNLTCIFKRKTPFPWPIILDVHLSFRGCNFLIKSGPAFSYFSQAVGRQSMVTVGEAN